MASSLADLFERLYEGSPLAPALEAQESARRLASRGDYEQSAVTYARGIELVRSLGKAERWVLVRMLDEQAEVLLSVGDKQGAAAAATEALHIRRAYIDEQLGRRGAKPTTPLQRKVVRAAFPRLTPFVAVDREAGGLLYFDDAPYDTVLALAEKLGFAFFRERIKRSSHLDLLDDLEHDRHATSFGGYVVMPPRVDARVSLIWVRAPWSQRLKAFADEVGDRDKTRKYGLRTTVGWR